MRLLANVFCRDVAAQATFYARLLGIAEIAAHRSPIYRGLSVGGAEFGLNAMPAYALLGIEARRPAADAMPVTTAWPTFVVDTPGEVDAAIDGVEGLGGTVLKRPFATYYGQWQALAADPEGNAFRLACQALPAGAHAPALESLLADA